MKLLLLMVGLGAIVGACAGCITGRARSFTSRIEQYDRSVQVTSVCGTVRHDGSGVIINNHQVLTAFHVIGCANAVVTVTLFNGREIQGFVDTFDKRADLARVRLEHSPGAFAPVTVARTYVGDTICFQPRLPNDSRGCGVVTRVSDRPNGIEHDALSRGGNSGSGVYDRRGRLVGIVTRRVGDEGGQATPISANTRMLK